MTANQTSMSDNHDYVAHTPGPWVIDSESLRDGPKSVGPQTSRFGMEEIASIRTNGDNQTTLANARLIAAAPDLLAALIDVLDADGDLDAMDFNRYRAAIAKAEGRRS